MLFFDIFARSVSLMLTVSSYAMALRMILPLFADPEQSKLYALTCILSEPVVAPVRVILSAFGIGENTPTDIALPTAYILLFVIRLLLPAI